jgi:hypothetical protein
MKERRNEMGYKVDGWNNFCRVFELPAKFPEGFCFGGGKPTVFLMVDWFKPVAEIAQSAVSKEVWKEKVGEIETQEIEVEELSKLLIPWLQKKIYIKPNKSYLVICDFGACFTFDSTHD